MSEKRYANIIIDISHEAVDRSFQYIVPEKMRDMVFEGMEVNIPFGQGNNIRKGYIVSFSDQALWPVEKLKCIDSLSLNSIGIESKSMETAFWMKKRYGCTLISAIETVIPIKKKIKEKIYKTIVRKASLELIKETMAKCTSVKSFSRYKVLKELLEIEALSYEFVKDKLNVSDSVIKTLEKNGIISIEETREYRKPVIKYDAVNKKITYSGEQIAAINGMGELLDQNIFKTCLLYGVTGSGKTEVYIELISKAVNQGKQAIVLIPEIALTFQTLKRFYTRFGDKVSLIHSKLSDGEKYDLYQQAKNGDINIIIGPRSALFTPFDNVGIIIIDEEHETSYKSEKMPKYNAREVAMHICERENALLVLGSATPSMETYYSSLNGEYEMFKLTKRNGNALLPKVYTVDMRRELKEGNKSYFSKKLKELLTERIARGQQTMLFINRRGYAGFVSCRECGFVMKCPHCDVSLSHHKDRYGNQKMVCHYCGYEAKYVNICPKCHSKYFAGFKAGTEKIEEELKKEYPSIKVLRMDRDTTKNKDDYDKILSAFANREADVLVGTQMIVKGHDFPNVTLVGIIAADLSLNASDYKACERTFQLITQCSGRAGRGDEPGEVVIQTYSPDNYSIMHAANQNFEDFYKEEILYRNLADYPPICHMLAIIFLSEKENMVKNIADRVAEFLKQRLNDDYGIFGPAAASVSKINDIYRYVIYIKHNSIDNLVYVKDIIEDSDMESNAISAKVQIHYDFDPSGGI